MNMIFGEPWDAPVCETATVVETPVGDSCFWCGAPIEVDDRGHVIPYLGGNGETGFSSWHRECFLRSIFTCHEHRRAEDSGCPGPDCRTGSYARTPGEKRADALKFWANLPALSGDDQPPPTAG